MISKEFFIVVIFAFTLIGVIAGFVMGSCHEKLNQLRESREKQIIESQMKHMISEILREKERSK